MIVYYFKIWFKRLLCATIHYKVSVTLLNNIEPTVKVVPFSIIIIVKKVNSYIMNYNECV